MRVDYSYRRIRSCPTVKIMFVSWCDKCLYLFSLTALFLDVTQRSPQKTCCLNPNNIPFPFFNSITASSCGVDYIACIRPCQGVNSTRLDSCRRVVTQFVSWFVSLFGVCGDLTADHN